MRADMRLVAPFALLLLAPAPAGAQHPRSYQVSDLGSFVCPPTITCKNKSVEAEAISDSGLVAGFVQVGVCFHAALWRQGTWRELGALGTPPALDYSSSYAHDVNNRGQVVGNSATSITPESGVQVMHAYIWEESTGMRDLGVLGIYRFCYTYNGQQYCYTSNNSDARAINDLGQVVGTSSSAIGNGRAFLWENGSMIDLGIANTGEDLDINNAGQIVGTASSRGFLWENGVVTSLGSLDSVLPYSGAAAISNHGDVVGWSYVPEDGHHYRRAFLWRDGVMRALPALPGDNICEATGVNDRDQVIGTCMYCNPWCSPMHPVVWDGDEVIGLDTLPGTADGFIRPNGVNDRGWIVGTAQEEAPPYISHGFLAR
jgi:probable HAF family extracellular repeat protein